MAEQSGDAPVFEVGRTYVRRAIHAEHGGQQQGGISTPQGRPYLLLFTGTGDRHGYQDGYDGAGVFHYFGEGQVGDMTFTGGNKAIRDHAANGKDLYLFRQLGKGRGVRFEGIFACPSWEYRDGKDRLGNTRRAIVFHLVRQENAPDGGESEQVARTAQPQSEPLSGLRAKALAAAGAADQANVKSAKRNYYERSKAIRDYVLRRANGVCESCMSVAPFARPDGSPYLEPHHTRRLSDGGPDHPRWVAGICPNCHREIHHGVSGSSRNARLQSKLDALEREPPP